MSWNESNGNKKDPWSTNNNRGSKNELDKLISTLKETFGLGKSGSGGSNSGSSGAGAPFGGIFVIALLLAIGYAAWQSFIVIEDGNKGLLLRFGEYKKTLDPGFHIHLPGPIETVEVVDVFGSRTVPLNGEMLTSDENIVDITLEAQYRIQDPKNYLFEIEDQDTTVEEAVQSTLRELAGKNQLNYILNEGRQELAQQIQVISQRILDDYNSGIILTTANLTRVQPPTKVQPAFEDVISAREDKETKINEAEAIEKGLIPKAQGEADKLIEEAEAYKQRTIEEATGEAQRFVKLLVEYERAPEVTRERLYLETLEKVLGETNKVLIDTQGGAGSNQLMYIPLDKLMEQSRNSSTNNNQSSGNFSTSSQSNQNNNSIFEQSTQSGTNTRESR